MLIDCPECHSKVSDKARSCPSCGHPLRGVSESVLSAAKKGAIPAKKAAGAAVATAQKYFFLYVRYTIALIILLGIVLFFGEVIRINQTFETRHFWQIASIVVLVSLSIIWMQVTGNKFIGFLFFFVPIFFTGWLVDRLSPGYRDENAALMAICVMVIMLIITPPIADKYFMRKKSPEEEIPRSEELEEVERENNPELYR